MACPAVGRSELCRGEPRVALSVMAANMTQELASRCMQRAACNYVSCKGRPCPTLNQQVALSLILVSTDLTIVERSQVMPKQAVMLAGCHLSLSLSVWAHAWAGRCSQWPYWTRLTGYHALENDKLMLLLLCGGKSCRQCCQQCCERATAWRAFQGGSTSAAYGREFLPCCAPEP